MPRRLQPLQFASVLLQHKPQILRNSPLPVSEHTCAPCRYLYGARTGEILSYLKESEKDCWGLLDAYHRQVAASIALVLKDIDVRKEATPMLLLGSCFQIISANKPPLPFACELYQAFYGHVQAWPRCYC